MLVEKAYNTNSPELLLLNFLPLPYHQVDFTSFFTMALLGAAHFFTAGLFWIRFHFFCNCVLCIASILPSLIKCLLLSTFPIGDSLWI